MNVTIRSQLQQQARRQGLRFVPNQTSPPDCSSATQRTPGSPDASPSTQNGLSLLRRPDGISPSDFSSSHPLPFFHPARPFCARSVRRSVHVPPNFEPLASRSSFSLFAAFLLALPSVPTRKTLFLVPAHGPEAGDYSSRRSLRVS